MNRTSWIKLYIILYRILYIAQMSVLRPIPVLTLRIAVWARSGHSAQYRVLLVRLGMGEGERAKISAGSRAQNSCYAQSPY